MTRRAVKINQTFEIYFSTSDSIGSRMADQLLQQQQYIEQSHLSELKHEIYAKCMRDLKARNAQKE